MTSWFRNQYEKQKRKMFFNFYKEVTAKAIDNLQDDLVIVVEPKSLYEKGWNDAMKTVDRTLRNYKRCGVVK